MNISEQTVKCNKCKFSHKYMGTQSDGGHCYMFKDMILNCKKFEMANEYDSAPISARELENEAKLSEKSYNSHYDWLEDNLMQFFEKLKIDTIYNNKGLISAHGDKCYGYRYKFEENGIPFYHGVAIFLLSYVNPYAKEVKETEKGWIDVGDWIVSNYNRFEKFLPKV